MALIKKFRIKSFKKIKTIIEFNNVTLAYGNRIILDNISFKINEGQIFGMLGPNGVGKSTIFNLITGLIKPIKILNSEIDLQTTVSSYLLNSQLISLPSGGMMFLLPSEVKQYPNCMQWLEKISAEEEIKKIKFIDVKQSMRNGGGPACLRLRMIFNENEISSVNKNFLLDDNKIDLLTSLIENKYRDRLQPDDLLDPNLADESLEILDALTKIFKTGSIYNFQKI